MRNADYWRGRFSILEDSAHREAQKTIQGMEELYLDAQRSVQKEIESWYARFAVNNQISLTDARKWLTVGQLEEFHWSFLLLMNLFLLALIQLSQLTVLLKNSPNH